MNANLKAAQATANNDRHPETIKGYKRIIKKMTNWEKKVLLVANGRCKSTGMESVVVTVAVEYRRFLSENWNFQTKLVKGYHKHPELGSAPLDVGTATYGQHLAKQYQIIDLMTGILSCYSK